MKNYISRREFLKRISIGGSAVFVPLTFVRDRLDDTTFILYSNDAERDIRELTKAICRDFGLKAKFSGHKIDLDGSHRSYRAIFFQEIFSGVKPDLTIVQSDEVIDPSKSGMKNVRRFLHSLRKGKLSRHKIWISVKRRNILNILAGLEPNTNKVEIFANGKKVEEFDILKNYREIVVNGYAGKTVLENRNGKVRIVESACKHRNCIYEGFRTHGKIICAPNKVYVKLPDYNNIDAVTL